MSQNLIPIGKCTSKSFMGKRDLTNAKIFILAHHLTIKVLLQKGEMILEAI